MSRLLISFPLAALCAYFLSCGFMDLRPIEVTVEPGASNYLLAEENSPVILRFNTLMVKNEAEGILQVSSDSGVVNGDRFWNGNDLYFVPVAGWTAGIRHTLSLSGTIRAVDGRELRLEHFVSFYAINKNSRPFLENYSPSDGESTGTGGVCFEFQFSRPMNRLSVETALTVEGIGNKIFEWSDDDRKLKMSLGDKLSALTLYRWNLKDSAKSTDGVPLVKSYSSYFTTDLDKDIPKVDDVYPVMNTNGQWFPLGTNIETGLRAGQGIAVVFNKPMGENTLRSVRFEPSLSGRAEFLSEKSIVYIFSRNPEPEKNYTLIVSGDTSDVSGLKIGDDYKINFTPDILYLSILSFSVNGIFSVIDNNSSSAVLTVPIDSATGEILIDIRFSQSLSNEEKQNTALKISLSLFFPRQSSSVSPSLKDVSWIIDDRLQMQWERLSAGGEERHYYKLTIPGGKSGISKEDGTYMKEDYIVYLEAVK
jgi:hypothetical protein